MIKKQTINEIYLGNGILIQQYIFYCTTNNTILGGVLEAIDSQGHTFNVYSTSNVETLVLQLSYFIDDTIRIYCEETQKENDNYTGLSPSEREHFINWSKSKEEEEEEKEREEKDIAANRPDPYHADMAACLADLGEGTLLL